jgi:hypothetical protein
MTRFELPTHPSNNGIPGYAYDPTMYTRPCPGFREGRVREGLGRGNALRVSSCRSRSVNQQLIDDSDEGMKYGYRRKGHTVPAWLCLVLNPDQ